MAIGHRNRSKRVHYNYSDPSNKHRARRLVFGLIGVSFLVGGGYLVLLTQITYLPSSVFRSSIDLDTSDDETDSRNRIQIERIGIEVPYFDDNTPLSLEKGAWWRFPDRGNPISGGNFILSAHRFQLGFTPSGTRAKSPFYDIHKLSVDDTIRVFYNKKWYTYTISKIFSVKPDALEIEERTDKPQLTLYACTLKGSADGRFVIIASPQFITPNQKPSVPESPLL